MHKHRIIQSRVKDDGDYDYIYDNAIHNTLNEYWKWAETSNGTVSFEKSWGDEYYDLTLCVDAVFEDADDYALFKITYGTEPYNQLEINSNMEGEFIHG
jgi:hypothetical protein